MVKVNESMIILAKLSSYFLLYSFNKLFVEGTKVVCMSTTVCICPPVISGITGCTPNIYSTNEPMQINILQS